MRCVIAECLRDLGYNVLEAPGAREALAVSAIAGRIDLLLADVAMPGMSGAQLHRELCGCGGGPRAWSSSRTRTAGCT